MYRPVYLLTALALLLPAALTGCSRAESTMSPEMQREAAERSGIPGDMIAGAAASNTIAENARAVADLDTFAEMLATTDLADVLEGPGPYTVFAPSDEAFDLADADDLLAGTMDADTREELTELLRAHIVEGEIMFDELNEGMVIETIDGEDYTIARQSTDLLQKRIDEADIVAYDIESSNGVIHVINLVLDDDGFFSQQ